MNNLQRIEHLCTASRWSATTGMSGLLNSITLICVEKDQDAFCALLKHCAKNSRLADFVLDTTTATSLLDNQWDDMWVQFITASIDAVPEKMSKIIRCARPNSSMFQSAQDLIWEKIETYEHGFSSKGPHNLKPQQTLLSSLAVVAVYSHNQALYEQCFKHWRDFDKMYIPLQYTLDEQILYAGKSAQIWLPQKIMPYLQKQDLIVDYMEQALQLFKADDVEQLMQQHNKIHPKDRLVATKIIEFITKREQLWTAENIVLIKKLCATPEPIRPRVYINVLSAALGAHHNNALNFSEVLELCNSVCAWPPFSRSGTLLSLVKQSVKNDDFRLLKHMSLNHSQMYLSGLSDSRQGNDFLENMNKILFRVDHATDVFISQTQLDNEEINAFRQKLKLSESTEHSSIDLSSSAKRKI